MGKLGGSISHYHLTEMRTSSLLVALIVFDKVSCDGLDVGAKPSHSDLIIAAKAIVEKPVDLKDH